MYSCDFETTTDPADCRVWAWVAINILNTNERNYGNTIESFIQWLSGKSKKCYFHNLKFDGSFILDYLLKTNWTLNKSKKDLQPYEFNTLISDKGFFYTMALKFPKANIEIIDFKSLKLSEKFTPAVYEYKKGVWEGGSVSMFTPVMKFTLFERFSEEVLEVTETIEVNGKRTFGYDLPLEYRRI